MSSKKPDSRWAIFMSVVVLALFADLATKYLVASGAWTGETLGGMLRITHVRNPGAAFGLLPGARLFFIAVKLVALVVIFQIVRLGNRQESRAMLLPLSMIFAGALGNLTDRLRGSGEVIDFIDFSVAGHHWYIFNVADSCISVGAVLILFHLLFTSRKQSGAA